MDCNDVNRIGVLFLTTAVIVVSADAEAGTPILAHDQVVQIANKFAIDRGIDLSKYKRPLAHYEAVTKDEEWCLLYDGKSLAMGDHFYIFVHDKTRKIRLRGGL